MAVALDTVGTKGSTNGTPATTLDATGTVGSGSNRALVVQIAFDLTTVSAVTVVWDPAGANQSMTLISSSTGSSAGRVSLYGLVNPTTGASKPIRASWTGSTDAGINGVSFTGVNQTGGATSFPAATPTSGFSTAPSITITSATGNATMDCSYDNSGGYSAPTQTSDMIDGSFNNGGCGASYEVGGGATVTHAWTATDQQWVSVGTNIVAFVAGATNIYMWAFS